MVDARLYYRAATEPRDVNWRWNDLTPRQKEIALASVMNRDVKQKRKGEQFGISYGTWRFHLSRAMRTLGVRDVVELAFEMGRHWSEIERTDNYANRSLRTSNKEISDRKVLG